ncbi:MAG TPA: biotin/lipoyl-containing protein [Paludibacter sp.]|nr:biotin/lipoyl-containing protein [Paludibacter sp.]
MKKFKFKIDGSEYEVSINEIEQNIAEIEVNGTPFTVEIERQSPALNRKPAGKVSTPIKAPARTAVASAIKAPLPGSIMKVLVTNGQTVRRGDLLLTMESMKMENNILAEHDGIIRNVHVQPGQTVMQDDVLIDFEGAEPEIVTPVAVPAAEPAQKPAAPVQRAAGIKTVKSPLPGSVLKISVSVGQEVKKGDQLLVLESMKMENSILCEKDAVVKAIHVQAGQSVMQDDPLFDLE